MTTQNITEISHENIISTGDTSSTPEAIIATGPEDFVSVIVGIVIVAGAGYAAWQYRLSRVAVKSALLRK